MKLISACDCCNVTLVLPSVWYFSRILADVSEDSPGGPLQPPPSPRRVTSHLLSRPAMVSRGDGIPFTRTSGGSAKQPLLRGGGCVQRDALKTCTL